MNLSMLALVSHEWAESEQKQFEKFLHFTDALIESKQLQHAQTTVEYVDNPEGSVW